MHLKKVLLLNVFLLGLGLCGCQSSVPKGILKPNATALETRFLQSRSFDTNNENSILSASASALQDMGFTIDESETKLGLIVASKNADATDKAQVALATTSMILGALSGSYSSSTYGDLDDIQKVRASLVTHANPKQKNVHVRITFQRIVWNKNKQICKMETLNDKKLYQGFFDHLSKAVFLEDHQI